MHERPARRIPRRDFVENFGICVVRGAVAVHVPPPPVAFRAPHVEALLPLLRPLWRLPFSCRSGEHQSPAKAGGARRGRRDAHRRRFRVAQVVHKDAAPRRALAVGARAPDGEVLLAAGAEEEGGRGPESLPVGLAARVGLCRGELGHMGIVLDRPPPGHGRHPACLPRSASDGEAALRLHHPPPRGGRIGVGVGCCRRYLLQGRHGRTKLARLAGYADIPRLRVVVEPNGARALVLGQIFPEGPL
mmetsp:Transcript_27325/g.87565  ORF Transcript_27325/g.87565 Transcript_27325/m.87565 type:complete len:246 (+) Transcript_27325:1260-1997(+)